MVIRRIKYCVVYKHIDALYLVPEEQKNHQRLLGLLL